MFLRSSNGAENTVWGAQGSGNSCHLGRGFFDSRVPAAARKAPYRNLHERAYSKPMSIWSQLASLAQRPFEAAAEDIEEMAATDLAMPKCGPDPNDLEFTAA